MCGTRHTVRSLKASPVVVVVVGRLCGIGMQMHDDARNARTSLSFAHFSPAWNHPPVASVMALCRHPAAPLPVHVAWDVTHGRGHKTSQEHSVVDFSWLFNYCVSRALRRRRGAVYSAEEIEMITKSQTALEQRSMTANGVSGGKENWNVYDLQVLALICIPIS